MYGNVVHVTERFKECVMSAMVARNTSIQFGSYTDAKFSTASTSSDYSPVEVETHMQYIDWQVCRSWIGCLT